MRKSANPRLRLATDATFAAPVTGRTVRAMPYQTSTKPAPRKLWSRLLNVAIVAALVSPIATCAWIGQAHAMKMISRQADGTFTTTIDGRQVESYALVAFGLQTGGAYVIDHGLTRDDCIALLPIAVAQMAAEGGVLGHPVCAKE